MLSIFSSWTLLVMDCKYFSLSLSSNKPNESYSFKTLLLVLRSSKIKARVNSLSEQYKDDLFLAIRRDPKLKKILKRVKIFIEYITLFSWFFMALAVISIFFYRKKIALILIGLTSGIHIVFAPLALIGLKKQNRYLLFAFCLGNLIWLTSVTFAFFYFIFMGKSFFFFPRIGLKFFCDSFSNSQTSLFTLQRF